MSISAGQWVSQRNGDSGLQREAEKGLCERTRGTLGLHEEAAFPQMKEGLEEGILWADCSRTNSKSGETLMEEKKIIKVTYPCPIILWPLKVSGREWSCGSGGIPKEWKWDRRKC